jgi:hypothetical protein
MSLRLSEAEKKALPKERAWQGESYDVGVSGGLGWLYLNDVEADMAQELPSLRNARSVRT